MITNTIHSIADYSFNAASVGIPIAAVATGQYYLIPAGPILFLAYPIILEPLTNLYGWVTYSDSRAQKEYDYKVKTMKEGDYIGIIYSSSYNMTACGIEKLHPFDSQKYGR